MFSKTTILLLFACVALVLAGAATADTVIWDTGPPITVIFNGSETYLGFISGYFNDSMPQRWTAVPFRIAADTVITGVDFDGWANDDSGRLPNPDRQDYIIWRRTGLAAPVNGDQYKSGTLGPWTAGIDDPRLFAGNAWLHQYRGLNIPIAAGDYYLTIYAARNDGGMCDDPWLTGGDQQAEDLEQIFMWRSASFPSPGFEAYTAGGAAQPKAGQDPGDVWNVCFKLFTSVSPEKNKIGYIKTLPDGSDVMLDGKPVTLSPKTAGVRSTDYIYVEEIDRNAGIRVKSTADVAAGDLVSVAGKMATTAAGERYIDLASVSRTGGPQSVRPLGHNTKGVHEDALAEGLLIRVAARVRDIELDGSGRPASFRLADGYTKNGAEVLTKVVVVGEDIEGTPLGWLMVGGDVSVTGAASAELDGIGNKVRVILLRGLTLNM